MDPRTNQSDSSFFISPATHGLDASMLSQVSGAVTIVGGKYRLNVAELISTQQFRFGELEFSMNIPTVPTVGDSRKFGFYGKSIGNRGAVVFGITGAVFAAQVYDKDGNLVFNEAIKWITGWEGAQTRFRIAWKQNSVTFAIISSAGNYSTTYNANNIQVSLPVFFGVLNTNADNLDLQSISIIGSESFNPSSGIVTTQKQLRKKPSAVYDPSEFRSFTLTASNIKAAAGYLVGFIVYNTTGAARYLQFFNSITAPNPGDAPDLPPFLVPAGGHLIVKAADLGGDSGRWFPTGLSAGNSSTPATLTAGASGDLLLVAFYTS